MKKRSREHPRAEHKTSVVIHVSYPWPWTCCWTCGEKIWYKFPRAWAKAQADARLWGGGVATARRATALAYVITWRCHVINRQASALEVRLSINCVAFLFVWRMDLKWNRLQIIWSRNVCDESELVRSCVAMYCIFRRRKGTGDSGCRNGCDRPWWYTDI
jgi:hypothetical protein